LAKRFPDERVKIRKIKIFTFTIAIKFEDRGAVRQRDGKKFLLNVCQKNFVYGSTTHIPNLLNNGWPIM